MNGAHYRQRTLLVPNDASYFTARVLTIVHALRAKSKQPLFVWRPQLARAQFLMVTNVLANTFAPTQPLRHANYINEHNGTRFRDVAIHPNRIIRSPNVLFSPRKGAGLNLPRVTTCIMRESSGYQAQCFVSLLMLNIFHGRMLSGARLQDHH